MIMKKSHGEKNMIECEKCAILFVDINVSSAIKRYGQMEDATHIVNKRRILSSKIRRYSNGNGYWSSSKDNIHGTSYR